MGLASNEDTQYKAYKRLKAKVKKSHERKRKVVKK